MNEIIKWIKQHLSEEAAGNGSLMTELSSKIEKYSESTISEALEKKAEILSEKKKLQTKYKEVELELESLKKIVSEFETKGISEKAINDLKTQIASLEASSTSPEDLKEKEQSMFKAGREDFEKEFSPKLEEEKTKAVKATDDLTTFKNKYVQRAAQNELDQALVDMKIDSDKYWKKGLFNDTEVEYDLETDKVSVSIKTESGTMPLKDWITWYPTTEEGKRKIKAPNNKGGGALGGSSSHQGEDTDDAIVDTKTLFDNLFPTA